MVDPKLELARVNLVKDTRSIRTSPNFNAKAARAKLMSRTGADDGSFAFGSEASRPPGTRAW